MKQRRVQDNQEAAIYFNPSGVGRETTVCCILAACCSIAVWDKETMDFLRINSMRPSG